MTDAADEDPVTRTVTAWCAAAETGDADAATNCLSERAELISPLTAAYRFRGRDQIHQMLQAAFEVISDIDYHTVLGDGAARAVFFTGRCGTQSLEEAQLLRFDPTGQITELTLFGRPLPGLTAVMAEIGPRLTRRQGGGRGLQTAIAAAVKPLASMTRMGERLLVPRTDPARLRRRP